MSQAANHLKAWREFAGLTQAQVEQLNGWPASRISNLENGRAILTEAVLIALARRYGCLPAQLLEAPPPQSMVLGQHYNPERGTAALQGALSRLEHLAEDVRAMRGEIGPRLDAFETQISQAHATIKAAMQSATAMAAMFDRFLESFRGEELVAGAPEPASAPKMEGTGSQKVETRL